MFFKIIVLINRIIAVLIIASFCIEVLSILFADFSNNRGTTKGVVFEYFILIYIWSIIPAIIFFASKKVRKNIYALVVLLVLNIFILIIGLPMLMAYL
jgi:hypothetical protein